MARSSYTNEFFLVQKEIHAHCKETGIFKKKKKERNVNCTLYDQPGIIMVNALISVFLVGLIGTMVNAHYYVLPYFS